MAVATPERIALSERVRELRELGLRQVDVADQLGISRSYAAELEIDPDGARAARRKGRYRLPCPLCGKLMDGSNGLSGSPSYCARCTADLSKVWTREMIIRAMRVWFSEHGRPPSAAEWMRPSRGRRFPSTNSVFRGRAGRVHNPSAPFETWNDALIAAGFTPQRVQTTWTRWTRELVLAEIRANSEGTRGPSSNVLGKRLFGAACRQFGSWQEACAVAGVVPRSEWCRL